jgi:hypothetical protein
VTIEKGKSWGEPGALPDAGVVVKTDAAARQALEAARRDREPFPVLGLLGGDLCRTLGGPGDEARLRGAEATTFTVDVGEVLIDGRLHFFVAHLVARRALWRQCFVAMNAQWLGPWNLGPRAHPNDGLLDTYDAHLTWADLPKVRARLPQGAHLPHPRIVQRRTAAMQVEFPAPRPVWLDGELAGEGTTLAIRLHPDALRVVI